MVDLAGPAFGFYAVSLKGLGDQDNRSQGAESGQVISGGPGTFAAWAYAARFGKSGREREAGRTLPCPTLRGFWDL